MVAVTRTRGSQSGVMLIEALLGILIFSIGILALIGMQAQAVRNTQDARYRSEAAFLASQIIARMWVDNVNLAQYADATCAGYAPCADWRAQVEARMPGVRIAAGQRVPTIVLGAGNQATVTVFWLQPGENEQRQVQLVNLINPATAP